VTIVHRVGPLAPQDPIVLVGVASSHRGEAFQACEFLIDYLKTRAPFWKKETSDAGERWVESRQADEVAAGRWGEGSGGQRPSEP
jgi:molybdopterin synthase catalytic subunit